MKTWGEVYRAALKKGYDHGYAAYLADNYLRRFNAYQHRFRNSSHIK